MLESDRMDKRLEDMNLDEAVAKLAQRASWMNVGLGIGGTTEALPYLINPVIKVATIVLRLGSQSAMFTGTGGLPLKPADQLVAELFQSVAGDEGEDVIPSDVKRTVLESLDYCGVDDITGEQIRKAREWIESHREGTDDERF